jgi:hypothetical protein
MIDFPPNVARQNFRKLFSRGALFHCKNYNFEDSTTKNKFLLVLNGHHDSGKSYFYLPTSQVEKLKNNKLSTPRLYIFPSDCIHAFTKETGILIFPILHKAVAYFEAKCQGCGDGTLTYCEPVPEQIMQEIDSAIIASKDISLSTKKIILPERYLAKN